MESSLKKTRRTTSSLRLPQSKRFISVKELSKNKLTAPSLWNEGKHHDNAKGDKLTAKSIENERKDLKMQKWDKLSLRTYKNITLWESDIT